MRAAAPELGRAPSCAGGAIPSGRRGHRHEPRVGSRECPTAPPRHGRRGQRRALQSWMRQTLLFLRLTLLLPGLGLLTAGCDELLGSKTCTDVWCGSEAGVVITRPGVWANGAYTLEVRLDGQVHVCSFTLPISGKLPHELQLSGEPFDCAPELPATYRPYAAALYPTPDETQSCLASSRRSPRARHSTRVITSSCTSRPLPTSSGCGWRSAIASCSSRPPPCNTGGSSRTGPSAAPSATRARSSIPSRSRSEGHRRSFLPLRAAAPRLGRIGDPGGDGCGPALAFSRVRANERNPRAALGWWP